MTIKTLKSVPIKRYGKHDRERKVLFGLVEYYLATGKPVGSNTLKEADFEDLSSATIRNYFAHLEEEGYLKQQHSSGGRIPTDSAYRLYASEFYESTLIDQASEKSLSELRSIETKEVSLYLHQAVEKLSNLTNMAVFLSAPRFDQDFILDIKLVALDHNRCLCIVVTDFGVIQTEILHTDKKLSSFSVKRMEDYFRWRLTGLDKPENLEEEEESIAQKLYNELMVRYIVGYTNFTDEDIYRTGFSKLLNYPEFKDESSALASSLALFENLHRLRLMVRECSKMNKVRYWIGEDFAPNSTLICIPYYINQKPIGSVGVLGPTRIPYKHCFGLLRYFSECISESLTKSLYKFKINFRQPSEEVFGVGQSRLMLLEDKS